MINLRRSPKRINKFSALKIITILIIITFFAQFSIVRSATSNSSIEQAEVSIGNAFNKVLAAEEAGGNVTALILKLNSAGELLASAQNAYLSGNVANAKDDAVTAQLIADQVASDASTLIDSSLASGRVNFIITAIFSIVGASIFLIALFLVWRSVKRSYMRKLNRLKLKGNYVP